MALERHPTPHFEPGRAGNAPQLIVVHTTMGSFDSAIHWFADPASNVSAHYLVALNGRIVQFVDEGDTARHAGRVDRPTARLVPGINPNRYSIGIEFEDGGEPETVVRPPEQYRAGARLLADIALRCGIPIDRSHVIGHQEVFAAKPCPGNLDIERLVREALALAAAERGDR
jgi:N-acetylmuramoyl-L-alanine amidase